MSDILFTFDDDSQALMHYGVKGMHWGVWNSETAARYGGGTARHLGKAQELRDKASGYSTKRTAAANKSLENSTKAASYRAKADKAAYKQAKYERQRDRLKGRKIQSDFSIAKAERLDRKAARQRVRQEKFSTKADKASGKYNAAADKYSKATAKMSKAEAKAIKHEYKAVMAAAKFQDKTISKADKKLLKAGKTSVDSVLANASYKKPRVHGFDSYEKAVKAKDTISKSHPDAKASLIVNTWDPSVPEFRVETQGIGASGTRKLRKQTGSSDMSFANKRMHGYR